MCSIIWILGELLLWSIVLLLLWHELLLILSIVHTRVVLVHLLTRLEVHWHLLLLGSHSLTVQNLLTLGLAHPALVAVLFERRILIEASLACPVTGISLFVVDKISSASVVNSMVVVIELYDSITSCDSDEFAILLLGDSVYFMCFLGFNSLSLFFGHIFIFDSSLFFALVASSSAFAVEVFARWTLPSNDRVFSNILDESWLNRENWFGVVFLAGIVSTVWRIVCSWCFFFVKNIANAGFHVSDFIVTIKEITW